MPNMKQFSLLTLLLSTFSVHAFGTEGNQAVGYIAMQVRFLAFIQPSLSLLMPNIPSSLPRERAPSSSPPLVLSTRSRWGLRRP